MGEYPTKAEIKTLKRLANITGSWKPVVDYLETVWYLPRWGIKGKGVHLQLHTGGWSGNEEIIAALQNTQFWFLFWITSKRGGHYYFKRKLFLERGIK